VSAFLCQEVTLENHYIEKGGRINIKLENIYLIGVNIHRSQEYSKFIDKSVGSIYNKFAINVVMSIFQGDEDVLLR